MRNLAFHFKPPVINASGFPLTRAVEDAKGRMTLVKVDDPYEGLSAESFDLQAQLDAGVPLQHISPVSPSSLSSIDKNNHVAEQFINGLNTNENE